MQKKLFKKIMAERGISSGVLAKRAKILRLVLWLRLWGIGEFTLEQMGRIARLLKLSPAEVNQIFFDKKVS